MTGHHGAMSRLVRTCGWTLIAVGLVALGLWIVVEAAGARLDSEFNRWVGWANVFALLTSAVGTALVIIDRLTNRSAPPPPTAAPAPPEAPRMQIQNVHASGTAPTQVVMNGNIYHSGPARTGRRPDEADGSDAS